MANAPNDVPLDKEGNHAAPVVANPNPPIINDDDVLLPAENPLNAAAVEQANGNAVMPHLTPVVLKNFNWAIEGVLSGFKEAVREAGIHSPSTTVDSLMAMTPPWWGSTCKPPSRSAVEKSLAVLRRDDRSMNNPLSAVPSRTLPRLDGADANCARHSDAWRQQPLGLCRTRYIAPQCQSKDVQPLIGHTSSKRRKAMVTSNAENKSKSHSPEMH